MKTYQFNGIEMMAEDATGTRPAWPFVQLPHVLQSYFAEGWRLPTETEARMMGELAALGVGGFQQSRWAAGMLYDYYWTSGQVPEWGKKTHHVGVALATYPGEGYELQRVSKVDPCRARLVRDKIRDL